MDYSYLVPPGVGLTNPSVEVWTNTPGDVQVSSDWAIGQAYVEGRVVYAQLSGGVEGTDYQIRWKVDDTEGNTWPRTGLVLCAQTA